MITRHHRRAPATRLARIARLTLVSTAVALAVGAADAQERRPITETDLYDFVWIADPQMSPDGSKVVFTRVVVNDKRDDYESSLWIRTGIGRRAAAAAHVRQAGYDTTLVA
jgi:pyruvate/2-oxoglutarate/acetoin dehydrogenase E1 component